MWTCEESVEARASPEQAWAAWTDVDVLARAPDLESISIDGPFAPGARLRMKPQGMPAARLQITRVEKPRVWTDVSRGPGWKMTFEHIVEPREGSVRLTERVAVTGPLAGLLGRFLGGKLRAAARASVEHVASEVAPA
jgi:carbon monoxide dehydrogenase subunit G